MKPVMDEVENVDKHALLRADFAMLSNGNIYLDSSSTSLKPVQVAQAIGKVYSHYCSNVGRSNHQIAEHVTSEFENVRTKVALMLNCYVDEAAFSFNCTDSINTVANSLHLTNEDQVIVSELEHHSNLLPWLNRAKVKVVRTLESGTIDLDHLEELLKTRTRLISVTYASNVTGNVQPVKEICRLAKQYGAISLIDGAQATGHFHVDVKDIGCDFYAFSAHKMMGPSGVGVLYMKRDMQSLLGFSRYGGGMVNMVTSDAISYHTGPAKFEAGTPNIEGVIGFGAALDYIANVGVEYIHRHNRSLSDYFINHQNADRNIIYPFPLASDRIPVFTFRPKGNIDINYISRILSDRYKIAVSTGYQCNQPLYRRKNIDGAIRVSLHVYNNRSDVDVFYQAIEELEMFLA